MRQRPAGSVRVRRAGHRLEPAIATVAPAAGEPSPRVTSTPSEPKRRSARVTGPVTRWRSADS